LNTSVVDVDVVDRANWKWNWGCASPADSADYRIWQFIDVRRLRQHPGGPSRPS